MNIFIADSAVFMTNKPMDATITITTPSVIHELKSHESKLYFDLLKEQGLRIELPSTKSLEKIKKLSQISKDHDALSDTDIDILALAHDYKNDVILFTDDYAIQNVASIADIKVQSVVQKKIKDILIWQKICIGCKRKFETGTECPICGSPLRKCRKRKL